MAPAPSSSDVLPSINDAAGGSTTDGPVMSFLNKRIRSLRKKHNRILQMEESLAQGRTLNSEQQELLRSKSSVIFLIDELEKLRSPLSSAVSEEISLALSSQTQNPLPPQQPPLCGPTEDQEQATVGDEDGKRNSVVEDLLYLLYFGSLFDVMPQSEFTSLMLTRIHERGCCLTYDYVTDDAVDLLRERDLDLISAIKGLLISRPVDSSLSHKDALRQCIEHAKLWIAKSDQPIHPDSEITYAGLRGKLAKIISSDYYTATPEIKAAVEMAAAAAAGNFGSFQVPFHGSMMPLQVDGSHRQHHDIEENNAHGVEFETADNQLDPVDVLPKDDLEAEKPRERVPIQSDEEKQEADGELRDQQYAPRRTYQNQRGGRGSGNGRRGYPNGRGGRGGGPYQNGRNQYYDQGGNYYARNYTRGRGWRGAGGNNYNNHGSAANGGDIGVAS